MFPVRAAVTVSGPLPSWYYKTTQPHDEGGSAMQTCLIQHLAASSFLPMLTTATPSATFLTCGWPKPSTSCSDMPSRTRTRSRRALLCRVGISDRNQTTQLIRSCDLAICCDLSRDLSLQATTNRTVHLKPPSSHLLRSSRQV